MPIGGAFFAAFLGLGTAALLGCGGKGPSPSSPSPPVAEGSAPTGAAGSSAEGADTPHGATPHPAGQGSGAGKMPGDCASRDADICLPEAAFVKRLCDGSFPDAALRFFVGGTPWTRGYLTRDIDGWNAEGGSAARARLAFDEEVVLLRRRVPPKGGMVVGSGGGGYLVLRVDGSCYTVDEIEVTRRKPPKPKNGPVVFRYLDEATQNVLLKNARIEAAYTKRRKECKGATSGAVSKACELADAELARAVPEEIRKGVELPPPSRIP